MLCTPSFAVPCFAAYPSLGCGLQLTFTPHLCFGLVLLSSRLACSCSLVSHHIQHVIDLVKAEKHLYIRMSEKRRCLTCNSLFFHPALIQNPTFQEMDTPGCHSHRNLSSAPAHPCITHRQQRGIICWRIMLTHTTHIIHVCSFVC